MTNQEVYACNRNADVARIAGVAQGRFTAGRVWVLVPGAALALGVAGWIAPASPAPARQVVAARPLPAVQLPAADLLHVARITGYAERTVEPRVLGRSPFAFERARSTGAVVSSRRVPDAAGRRAEGTRVDQTAAALEPVPDLAGIAEDDGRDGLVRTAVFLAPDGAIRLALIGQDAGGGCRVAIIDTDRVVLLHARTGRTFELRLE